MFVLNVLIASTVFISSQAASVDGLFEKCSIKDDECLKRANKKVLQSIGKTGLPDLGIPSIDPVTVQNFTVTVLDSLTLTFNEGVVKGVKDCDFKKYHIDLEKKVGTVKIVCDLNVKGHFVVAGSSPAIRSLLGRDSIKGEGNSKVKLEKLSLEFTFPLNLKKHNDDKIYLDYPDSKNIKFKYDIEKATFAADKIFIGKEDISQLVVAYLNENWKIVMQNFGKSFIEKAIAFYSKFVRAWFDQIPIENMVTDDLSAYVN